jgi:hypothetical protein
MRTIICSDAHGYLSLITNALAATGFVEGRDRFVYAGDLMDRGPDPVGCFELVDSVADVVLFGNHDVACALGLPIAPRDPNATVLADRLRDRATGEDPRWRLATVVDGTLVTHGGVAEDWRDALEGCGRNLDDFAAELNRLFKAQFARALRTGAREWSKGVLGYAGPLWFRPLEDGPPLLDIVQVVGHTPIEFLERCDRELLVLLGVHAIDPGAFRFADADGPGSHFRCAVIENGRVEVVESSGIRDVGGRPDSLLCY